MADIKISELPTSPAITDNNRIPYTTGTATRTVAVNTGNSANTLMLRDGSGNVSVNTLSANTVGQPGVTTFFGNGANLTGVTGIPVGTILPFGGLTAPTGFLLCDGTAISRTTFGALLGVIGTTYGAGNGSTTFNLPDLRGRMMVGAGTGPGLTTRSVGVGGGAETHTLTISQMPSHSHTYGRLSISDPRSVSIRGGSPSAPLRDIGSTTNPEGGSQAHNNMPPFMGINFIIKT